MKKIILAGIFSLILLLGIFSYGFYSILEVEIFEMDAYIVEDEIGFNLDEDKLHFGNIPVYGSGSFRELTIENVYDEDVKVFLSDSGNIDDFVYFEVDGGSFEECEFVLSVNETKNFKVVFKNENTNAGDYYSGKLRIVTKRLII